MVMIIKIRTEHHGCVNIRAFKFYVADGIGICSLRICGLFGIAETFCILIDYGVIRKMTAKLFDICRINGIRLCGIAQYICRLKLNGIELNIAAEVSGEKIEAVHMLPGYTHNIINLSDTDDLVTVMWANEQFDPEHPDTFGEKV